jgi:hypothetical protein
MANNWHTKKSKYSFYHILKTAFHSRSLRQIDILGTQFFIGTKSSLRADDEWSRVGFRLAPVTLSWPPPEQAVQETKPGGK